MDPLNTKFKFGIQLALKNTNQLQKAIFILQQE